MARTPEQNSALDEYYRASCAFWGESWGPTGPSTSVTLEIEEAEIDVLIHGIPPEVLGLSTVRASRAVARDKKDTSS